MQLSVTQDGHVHFGDKVMLANPDYPEPEAGLFMGGDLSLCMTPDEMTAHLSDQLQAPCGLSAAPTKSPVGRNTFIILRYRRFNFRLTFIINVFTSSFGKPGDQSSVAWR